jgi:agmatine deiminase
MSDPNVTDPVATELQPSGLTDSDGGPWRWVAEWHPHSATWIAWPHNVETWPGRMEGVPETFERLVRTLAEVETVHVLAAPGPVADQAAQMLAGCQSAILHPLTTNDCWIRDYGPTFVVSRDGERLAGVDWVYTAWGGKYPPFDQDARNAARICERLDCPRLVSPLVAEGGALETDGEGTLMTTPACLMNMNRNPGWNRSQVEQQLKHWLGLDKVLWVEDGGLAGDDTDSHIDQLARFVAPGRVVTAEAYSQDDQNAAGLQQQAAQLRRMTDARQRQLDVIPLRCPPPRYIEGQRVPESYCNFYIANQIVVVPTFGFRATDEAAIDVLRQLMPDRTIVPIDARALVWGLGAFHCATQQQPAVGLRSAAD